MGHYDGTNIEKGQAMKSFNMLMSSPLDGDPGENRYFIDGTRVSQDEFDKLTRFSARRDTFHTYRFARRWHFRSVCYA